jgi:hypothetical protein
MAVKTLDDYLLTLAHLMGERTVQTSTTASRTTFIQTTLDEVYRAYRWPFSTARETVTITGGLGDLPDDFDYRQGFSVYYLEGTTQVPMELINETDQTHWIEGDYKYWLTTDDGEAYTLNTKDTPSSVVVQYQKKAPDIATEDCPFEDTMAVALGARRYIKLSQDPSADISQDEAIFQKRLQENISATQVGNPKRRMRFISNANGYRIGGGYD